MASQDSLEHLLQELDLLSCAVCFEEFEKDGNHIPRLLPCTQTLCEACVKQLIRDNRLECPECRTEHGADDKEKSFPQNKYLLMHIMRKSRNWKLDQKQKKLCEEHRQELFLFCNEPECKKPICLVCLRKSHNKHDVMDIMDDKREILKKKISYIEKNLREKIIIFNAAITEVIRKTEDCLNDLKKRRAETTDEIDDEFDKMKEEVNDKLRETSSLLEKEVVTLEENLTLLSSMKQNAEDTKDNRDGGFSDLMDTIETVKETVNKSFSGWRRYRHPQFFTEPVHFGNITERQFRVKLPEIDENAVLVETPLRNIRDASQLKCTVTRSVYTGMETIGPIQLLSDGSIVFYGPDQLHNKLKRHNLHTGTEVSCVDISDSLWGCSVVELGGTPSLALSFGSKAVVEFRHLNNLNEILYIHEVAPMKPVRIRRESESVLLYYCRTDTEQDEIHWLDCTTLPPRIMKHRNITYLPMNMWWDMCFVQEQNKTLVIVTGIGQQGIHAYNADTKLLEWKREIGGMGKAGIASDGHGHLFVFDKANKCVHTLSVLNGQYMGCLIKEGDLGLRRPCWGVWYEETSSLIVAHAKGNERYLSVIRVQ